MSISTVRKKVRTSLEKAVTIAGELERGMAQQPLSEQGRKLIGLLDQPIIKVVLLSAMPGSSAIDGIRNLLGSGFGESSELEYHLVDDIVKFTEAPTTRVRIMKTADLVVVTGTVDWEVYAEILQEWRAAETPVAYLPTEPEQSVWLSGPSHGAPCIAAVASLLSPSGLQLDLAMQRTVTRSQTFLDTLSYACSTNETAAKAQTEELERRVALLKGAHNRDCRTLLDRLKLEFQGIEEAISTDLGRRTRKDFLPQGWIPQEIEAIVASISTKDLVHEKRQAGTRTRLDKPCLEAIENLVLARIKTWWKQELTSVLAGMSIATHNHSETVSQAFRQASAPSRFEDEWIAIEETCRLDPEGRVKVEGREPGSFRDMLQSARRTPMEVFALVTLMSGLSYWFGGTASTASVKPLLKASVPVAVIAIVIWQLIHRKSTLRQYRELELEKIQDLLRTELKRLFSQLHAEVVATLGSLLKRVPSNTLKLVHDHDLARREEENREGDAALFRASAKLPTLKAQTALMQNLLRQLIALKKELEACEDGVRSAATQALKGPEAVASESPARNARVRSTSN